MQKLASKFIEVMKECSHVAKSGTNSFHGYKYATCSDVLQKVNTSLTKNGIASVVSPEVVNLIDVTTAKGNIEHLATVKVEITLIDKDSGETVTLRGLGSGQDAGDKAIMKAQTAAIKYAYLLSLAISNGDDPEADTQTDESTSIAPSVANNNKASTMTVPHSILTCSECGSKISQKVADFSHDKFGRSLCMNCQRNSSAVA